MPSQFKPAKRGLFKRGPSKPGFLARFRKEYDAARVPLGLQGHVVAGPVAFRLVTALFQTMVSEEERAFIRRKARERSEQERARQNGSRI